MSSRPKRESKQTAFFTVDSVVTKQKSGASIGIDKSKKSKGQDHDMLVSESDHDTGPEHASSDEGDKNNEPESEDDEEVIAAFSKKTKASIQKQKADKGASKSAATAPESKAKGKPKRQGSRLTMKARPEDQDEDGNEVQEDEEAIAEDDDDDDDFRRKKKPKTAAAMYLSKTSKRINSSLASNTHTKKKKMGHADGFIDDSSAAKLPDGVSGVMSQLQLNQAESKGNDLYGYFFDSSNKAADIAQLLTHQLGTANSAAAAGTTIVNFVLLSAGASRNPIPAKVNLEGLNAEELLELYEEHLSGFSSAYPLLTFKGKTKDKHWRPRYEGLFCALATALLASAGTSGSAEGKRHLSALEQLVEHLVGLSASPVQAIRDAATAASLAVGVAVVQVGVARRAEIATLKRLLTAETKQRANSTGSAAKQQQLQRSLTNLEAASKSVDKLSTTIFMGVLVQRYKDVQPLLRQQCMRLLGDWIACDPAKYFKDEYVKYFGWMLVDDDSGVRLVTLEALIKIVAIAPNPAAFVPFLERFANVLASIASLDVEEKVRSHAMSFFLLLGQDNLLDTLDQTVLDRVDGVVFDKHSSLACRAQALQFMMDHTEGFEVEEEPEDEEEHDNEDEEGQVDEEIVQAEELGDEDAPKNMRGSVRRNRSTSSAAVATTTENTKAKKHVNQNAKDAHKRRQQATVQIETLCEFILMHVTDATHWAASIPLLVAAFTQLKDKRRNIVRDWSTMVALLLKEHDDLVSSAMRPQLLEVLLHLLVCSVLQLRGELAGAGAGPAGTNATGASMHTQHTRKENIEHVSLLAEVLKKDLTQLLTRGRDEPGHLMLISYLFESLGAGSKGKGIRPFLKQVTTLFDTCQAAPAVRTAMPTQSSALNPGVETVRVLIGVLRLWKTDADTATAAAIDSALSYMLSSIWDKVQSISSSLRSRLAGSTTAAVGKSRGGGAVGKGSKAGRADADGSSQLAELTFDLNAALHKLSVLTKGLDCSAHWPNGVSTTDIVDGLEQLQELCVQTLLAHGLGAQGTASAVSLPESSTADLSAACVASAEAMFSLVLWAWLDLSRFVQAKVTEVQAALTAATAAANTKRITAPTSRGTKRTRAANDSDQDDDNEEDLEEANQTSLLAEHVRAHTVDQGVSTAISFDAEELEHIATCVDSIDTLRSRLAEVLVSWMALGQPASDSNSPDQDPEHELETTRIRTSQSLATVPLYLRTLQRAGFTTINDLRALFPARLADVQVQGFDRLVFKPSQAVYALLREVFENEGRLLQELQDRATAADVEGTGSSEHDQHVHEQSLVLQSILTSLSSSLIGGNAATLNRRQAAAILTHYPSTHAPVVEIVKAFGKRLKDADIVRYLEVQMLALKSSYSELVAPALQQLEVLERTGQAQMFVPIPLADTSQEQGEPFEVGDYLRLIQTGCKKVDALAARLSMTLGISADQYARQDGPAGRAALTSFLSVGLHWALRDAPENALLLDSLAKYVRFLKADQLKTVRTTLRTLLEDNALGLFDLLEAYEAHVQLNQETDSDEEEAGSTSMVKRDKAKSEMRACDRLRAGALLGFLNAVGHRLPGVKSAVAAAAPHTGAAPSNRRRSVSSARDLDALLIVHGERVQSSDRLAARKRQQRTSSQGPTSVARSVSESRSQEEVQSEKPPAKARRGAKAVKAKGKGKYVSESSEGESSSSDQEVESPKPAISRNTTQQRAASKSVDTMEPLSPSHRRPTRSSSVNGPALSLALEDMEGFRTASSELAPVNAARSSVLPSSRRFLNRA